MNSEKNAEHLQKKTLKKVWKQRIKYIKTALDRGEDINDADNDKRNTLLHSAVLNAEVDVVKYLLHKKADITIKNSNDQTALEIAELLKGSDGKQIVSLLRKYQNGNYYSPRFQNSDCQQKQPENKPKVTKQNKSNHYQNRAGTTGINGQLYETKLLSLILLRALHDSEIEEYYLGTNVAGLGAFDDIVFRYKKHGEKQRPNIIFLQAKHKDDPEKDKISDEDTLKEDGNFSLHKYLKSYMSVLQKICSDSENKMFKGLLNDKNCEFIIYTPATEKFNVQTVMLQTDKENYLRTSESGKIYQFHVNDAIIGKLTPTIKKSLAIQIAERLSNFINKKTANNMMTDSIIKVYHVFLAQNVILLQDQGNKSNNLYIKVMFRQSFLETKDEHLLLMKNTICNDLKVLKGKPAAEIVEKIKSLSFEVPANFGNLNFHIMENEKEKQKTLKYLCTIFDKLFLSAHEDYIVEIKESDIGSDKSLQPTDIDKLASLVGNLLIFDQETKLLEFNLEEDHLSDDGLRLLKLLKKNNHPINRYRLDVNIPWFPKLLLSKDEDDKKLVRDFLKQVKFYTHQAKEDEVENVIKKEIDLILKENDSIFRVKNDTIFLKYHDEVQKWWKQSGWKEYLTKTCQFYNEAKQYTLDSPLLRILNYTISKTMNMYGIRFKPCAIEALKITDFLQDDTATLLVVVSNEITLSGIKCIQFFGENCDNGHTFLDLECVISNHYLEIVEKELKETKCSVLVIIDQTCSASQVTIQDLKKAFHGKIVLITSANVSDNLKNKITDGIIQRIDDNTNIFTDLEEEIQKMILAKREILFQGQNVSVTTIFDTAFLRAVHPKIIYKFIHNEKIVIGKLVTDKLFTKSVEFYINQSLCRYITVNIQNEENNTSLYSIDDGVPDSVKSEDNLKVTHEEMPKTAIDIEEKMVLISGESGMGKSTLLSHLAVRTKQKNPTMWVSKINFQDHYEQFTKWKSKTQTNKTQHNRTEQNRKIDLVEVFKFLYGAIDIKAFKDNDQATQEKIEKIGKRIVINNVNEIHLNNIDVEPDLFEIDVFNHCYNNNRVVLLFDGFDEVCPTYAYEAIQLLSTLKSSKVAHIWVTTRVNVVNQLQRDLGILSFKIMPLNLSDQKQYLQKIWTANLDLDEERSGSNHVKDYVNVFVKTYYRMIKENEKSFMGFPLHISLIADIFQNGVKNYVTSINKLRAISHMLDLSIDFDLWHLYKLFIKNKQTILYPDSIDPKYQIIIEKERKDFLHSHKLISAHTLFDEDVVKELFSYEDFEKVNNLMGNVKLGKEKAGIIECVIGSRPKFVHLSFCDYFATDFIFDILKSDSCTFSFWKYLIYDIFVADNKIGIRHFMYSKIREYDLFHETFYTKYSNEVLDILLSQICLLQFVVAIKERVDSIALFILECARSAINKDNSESLIKLLKKKIDDVSCLGHPGLGGRDDFLYYFYCLMISIDPKKPDYVTKRVKSELGY